MAYTVCNEHGAPTPLRIIAPDALGFPVLKEAFQPHWWVCDPCNPSHQRYEVTYGEGYQPQGLAWYEVVTTNDTAREIEVKLTHYRRVLEARQNAEAALLQYRRLTGCNYPQ